MKHLLTILSKFVISDIIFRTYGDDIHKTKLKKNLKIKNKTHVTGQ